MGGCSLHPLLFIITICFPAPWRQCNATGAEYDDDGVDVGDVDGDDGGVIYYYYCDNYSQSALDCFLNSTIIDLRDTGKEPREKAALRQGETKQRPTWTSWGLRQLQPMKDQRC